MTGAGFVARDRSTRKYLPSLRSILLSGRVYESVFEKDCMLQSLDELASLAGRNLRLGIRNGVMLQCVHVSWPSDVPAPQTIFAGTTLPLASDALGRMLLLAECEKDVRALVRHANAVGDPADAVDVDALVAALQEARAEGLAVCRDLVVEGDVVLAIGLPPRFGAPAAIGFGLPAARLAAEKATLAVLLRRFADEAWPQDDLPR